MLSFLIITRKIIIIFVSYYKFAFSWKLIIIYLNAILDSYDFVTWFPDFVSIVQISGKSLSVQRYVDVQSSNRRMQFKAFVPIFHLFIAIQKNVPPVSVIMVPATASAMRIGALNTELYAVGNVSSNWQFAWSF